MNETIRANPHWELLRVCLMNWPVTFGCFYLARTKLDNYHCVRTHCVGLTLLNCYPTFLLRKKELEQARQPYLFCARKKIICVAKARVMIDVFNFVRERPAPEATPSEPLMFVWPGRTFASLIWSVRMRLNL